MKVEQQTVFLLHRQAWQENSETLELLSPDFGRITLSRRLGSQNIPMFQELNMEWKNKRVSSWASKGQLHWLAGQDLYKGMYLNELIVRLLPLLEPQPIIYGLYSSTLHLLVSNEEGRSGEAALRYFERIILREIGYELSFSLDYEGMAINEKLLYNFDPDHGFFIADVASEISNNDIPGEVILAIDQNDWERELTLTWAKKIFRAALNKRLGSRPLNVRELLK